MTRVDTAGDLWGAVDTYLDSLHGADRDLEEVRARSEEAGLPDIAVSAGYGRLLTVLARTAGARTILEIGTLGGYSSICMARALPEDGSLVTLEVDPHHAEVARGNITDAGFADRVSVVVGPALDTLAAVESTHPDGFDLVFIDADKETYPEYWRWAMRLTHPGSLIVADNVVRDGAVADPADPDERVRGVRRYLEAVASEPAVVDATIQTVGAKGYDGLSIAWRG